MGKKIFALALVFALLAVPALAQERLARERAAYFGDDATPEGDIGAMILWGFYAPQEEVPECMGIDTLLIEFARPGVAGGDGFLRVLDAEDDSLFFECRGNDRECVDYQPSDLGGTNLYVTMDEPLESGRRYYLQMDDGLVTAGALSSKGLDSKSSLQLLVGDFGVDEMAMAEEYRLFQEAPLPVLLGSMATARLELDESFLRVSQSELTQDAVVRLTPLKTGETQISINFYDQAGNYVNGLIVPITVLQ